MEINLRPDAESKLIALAKQKGITPEELVIEIIRKNLGSDPETADVEKPDSDSKVASDSD